MTAHPLSDLSALDQFKSTPLPPGYPAGIRTFYSPVDNLKGALTFLINSAVHELDIAMFGFDDDQLVAAIETKLADPSIRVSLTLDSSQAGGVHESRLLAAAKLPRNSVAIGRSEHGAIMHLKLMSIDGTVLVSGSTNWSDGAEHLQDNELTVAVDPARAAEARIRIATIHAHMLAKAAGK